MASVDLTTLGLVDARTYQLRHSRSGIKHYTQNITQHIAKRTTIATDATTNPIIRLHNEHISSVHDK